MLEIPESSNIALQLNRVITGKTIKTVIADQSPHKFAFYHGDPLNYNRLLSKQVVERSLGMGSMVEFSAGSRRIVFSEGINLVRTPHL